MKFKGGKHINKITNDCHDCNNHIWCNMCSFCCELGPKHTSESNFDVYVWQSKKQMVLFPESCRIHLTAGLRLTWLSFMTAPQMDPTCLMPLNHDKVDFMGKPASCRPNMRGPRGHGWAKPTPTGKTFESSGFNRGVAYHRFLYVRRLTKRFSVFPSLLPSMFLHLSFVPTLVFDPIRNEKGLYLSAYLSVTLSFSSLSSWAGGS